MSKNNYDYSKYEEITKDEIAANIKAEYDEKYILKSLLMGKTREELAEEFNHKNYRTLDMYMRRRGYVWDGNKQVYISKPSESPKFEVASSTSKVDKIITLFNSGADPREIAKKVGMKDHRTMAMYMKDKGFIWSSERQNYVLLKGEQPSISIETEEYEDDITADGSCIQANFPPSPYPFEDLPSFMDSPKNDRMERLLPMLEMLDRNKDKLAELLSINDGSTIPRYVVGGITITKSLCMSHNLSELIKEFSKEKNISQREIFEVSIIEFLRKYGYGNEIKALFSS